MYSGGAEFQAYPNVALMEDIWLELTSGEVVKACEAVYGFCQSTMEWLKELRKTVGDAGLKNSEYLERLYLCRGGDWRIVILNTHVDGLLLTGDDGEETQKMVKYLLGRYGGHDLGLPGELVGVHMETTEGSITLH